MQQSPGVLAHTAAPSSDTARMALLLVDEVLLCLVDVDGGKRRERKSRLGPNLVEGRANPPARSAARGRADEEENEKEENDTHA